MLGKAADGLSVAFLFHNKKSRRSFDWSENMIFKRFLEILLRFALLVSLALTILASSSSPDFSQYDAVVVATGNDQADCERPNLPGVFVTQDVCNVQAAVNDHPGGKILLRGTFHFAEFGEDGHVIPGTDGTVFVTNDIEIHGEMDGSEFLTNIKGGYNTFSIGHLPVEWDFDFFSDEYRSSVDNAVPVKAAIQIIDFENPLYVPIRVWATTGVSILGNRIIDARSLEWDSSSWGMGIAVFPPAMANFENPELISGDISIKENFIDGQYRRAEPDDPWGTREEDNLIRGLGLGILLAQSEANILIEANEVRNVGDNGIDCNGNDGTTKIVNNVVHIPSPDGDLVDWPWGIEFCGDCWNDASETTKIVIEGNDISVGGQEGALGIHFDNAQVEPIVSVNKNNHLSGASAVGIGIEIASNAQIVGNEIEGVGEYGLVLGHPVESRQNLVDGNTLRDNVLENFIATKSDCLLGRGVTNNTLYVGDHLAVSDESGNDTNVIVIGE